MDVQLSRHMVHKRNPLFDTTSCSRNVVTVARDTPSQGITIGLLEKIEPEERLVGLIDSASITPPLSTTDDLGRESESNIGTRKTLD